jgi:molybdate transport system ATP-binding protein
VLRVEARARLGALDLDVALETPPGGCLALAGPSGAGKTSILRVVAGLLRPREGRVACGEEVWLDTARGIDVPPEERRCGYLFQEYALFGHLRAWQNVAYGLRDGPRAERRRRALELLDRFGVADLAEARPRTLSGGERQRVALGRALLARPRLLLLDEPLGSLDEERKAEILPYLMRLRDEANVPMVYVSHDAGEMRQLATQIVMLKRGRIAAFGGVEVLRSVIPGRE